MNSDVRFFIAQFVEIFAELLIIAIFIRVILSWFRPVNASPGRFTLLIYEITEPLLRVIRKILPRTGMLDLSPIVAFIIIELFRYLIISLL
ncbi:YggT family protein [Candidatus Peregrinibacteria bacterium]|nr:YggT family protein [Candidatus Peregrinibacteria bacterium]